MKPSSDSFSQFVDALESSDSSNAPLILKSDFERFLDHISDPQMTDRELIAMVKEHPEFATQKTPSGFTALLLSGFALNNLPAPASRTSLSLFLIEQGSDVHAKTYALAWNAILCHIKDPIVLDKLLQMGVDPNASLNESGLTPLTAATTRNYIESAKLLLDKGAKLMPVKSSAWNPILAASDQPDGELLKLYLSKASEQDLEQAFGAPTTPLHLAARAGLEDHLRLLLCLPQSHKAINAYNPIGNTPLHLAVHKGSVNIVHLLLQHGADVSLENKEGQTPEDLSKNDPIKSLVHLKGKRTHHPQPIGKKSKNIDAELAEPKPKKTVKTKPISSKVTVKNQSEATPATPSNPAKRAPKI